MSSSLRNALAGRSGIRSLSGCCLDCLHFCNDAASIERSFPGMTAMASAAADVRAYDGLCGLHGLYLAHTDGCPQFSTALRTGASNGVETLPVDKR
jgi:hypothetical protein